MTTEKILLEFLPEQENILPALKKINSAFGYIDKKNAEKVADYFSVSLAHIYETASFYDELKTKKQPPMVIQVCFSTHCSLKNSSAIISEIESALRIKEGDDNNLKFKLEKVSCMGRCGDGPIMVVNGKMHERVTASMVHVILEEYIC